MRRHQIEPGVMYEEKLRRSPGFEKTSHDEIYLLQCPAIFSKNYFAVIHSKSIKALYFFPSKAYEV